MLGMVLTITSTYLGFVFVSFSVSEWVCLFVCHIESTPKICIIYQYILLVINIRWFYAYCIYILNINGYCLKLQDRVVLMVWSIITVKALLWAFWPGHKLKYWAQWGLWWLLAFLIMWILFLSSISFYVIYFCTVVCPSWPDCLGHYIVWQWSGLLQ